MAKNAEKVLQRNSKASHESLTALMSLASAAIMRGDRRVAGDSLSRALALAEKSFNLTSQCYILNCCSDMARQFSDFQAAEGFCERAEAVLKQVEPNDKAIVQLTYFTECSRAEFLYFSGETDTGTVMMETAHRSLLSHVDGIDRVLSGSNFLSRGKLIQNILSMAAMIVRSTRETRVADAQYWKNKALEISRERLLAVQLMTIAEIMLVVDPADPEILSTLNTAESLVRAEGHHGALLQCLMMRCQVLQSTARWKEAELCILKTIPIAIERGHAENTAVLTAMSAEVSLGMNNCHDAIERYENAYQLFAALPNRQVESARCWNMSLKLRAL